MIEYDSIVKELERMMAAVGRGFNLEEETKSSRKPRPVYWGSRSSMTQPLRSKSLEKRCPRRAPPGLCPELRSLYSKCKESVRLVLLSDLRS